MTKLNEQNCKYCGKLYSLVYKDKAGYTSILRTSYCSKSCASKSLSKQNKGCILPDVGKETLRHKAINFIMNTGKHCSREEVCSGVGHSSKTFGKHNLKINDLNAEAGMIKPKSKFQGQVGEVLQKNFSHLEQEKTFNGLVGVKGHSLRVDFYIPEINTVVEADGSQHNDPNHPWKEWNNGTVAQYDKIKNDYFLQNGIRLVRIPYKLKIKESDVLSRLV